MPKFKLVIEETISQEFEVEALNPTNAMIELRDKYRSGDVVLDNAGLETAFIGVVQDDEITEWDRI